MLTKTCFLWSLQQLAVTMINCMCVPVSELVLTADLSFIVQFQIYHTTNVHHHKMCFVQHTSSFPRGQGNTLEAKGQNCPLTVDKNCYFVIHYAC